MSLTTPLSKGTASTPASEPQQGSNGSGAWGGSWESLCQLLLGGIDWAFSLENGFLSGSSERGKVDPLSWWCFSPKQLRFSLQGKPLSQPTLSDSLDLQGDSPPLSSPVCRDCTTNLPRNHDDINPAHPEENRRRPAGGNSLDLGRRQGEEGTCRLRQTPFSSEGPGSA